MEISELYQHYKQSTGITTDTRNIQPGNIFFALKGDNFNGNLFAAKAIENGALIAITDEDTGPPTEKIILVDNVLHTLQQLAFYHRKKFTGTVIALTGSNGKTTTKELIAAVLGSSFNTQATKGNLNNHIGIPLTLLSMPANLDFAIVEMGANHQQEIESYCQYVEPDFGFITNVGLAHIEGFGSFEGVIKGKTELYRHLAANRKKIFLNADNEVLTRKAKEIFAEQFDSNNVIQYGSAGNDLFCTGALKPGQELLAFSAHTKAESPVTIATHLVGNYNFENGLAAFCIGRYFGIAADTIKTALEAYLPNNNRSQLVNMGSNTIILDCYNANPSSMLAALGSFDKIQAGKKIIVLGEMMEMGEASTKVHHEIANKAFESDAAIKAFVGKGFSFLENDKKALWFGTTEAAVDWFKNLNVTDATILIKGSRANRLELLMA
jgi:UDP-N-acetylmuramoyl-tripeptide--D-alanyl-D-alanine ligase